MFTLIVAALLAGWARIAVAQESAEAQRRELATVPLSDANLAKYVRAAHNLSGYVRQHPDELKLKQSNEKYRSVDEAAKGVCDRRPPVRQAITSAGMTCKEFLIFTMRIELAAAAASQQLPPGMNVPPSDVAFYKKHKAEVMQALSDIGASEETDQ